MIYSPTLKQITHDLIHGANTRANGVTSVAYTKSKLLGHTSMSYAFMVINNFGFSQN